MFSLSTVLMRTIRPVALPAAVFAAGLAASAYGYVAGVRHSEAEQLAALKTQAEHYVFLLRGRLDLYAGATRALGAFFSASGRVDAREFDNYIRSARLFERLEGATSFGYLPRVAPAGVARFEARAGKVFPGYRMQDKRVDGDSHYPYLYAVHVSDPRRADKLRGFDVSSLPDSWNAMREAAQRDEPVASAVHAAARLAAQRPVVMVFAPVRHMADSPVAGGLRGFICATTYVDSLFRLFDGGRMANRFDIEVFDGRQDSEHLILDTDGRTHALDASSDHLLAHSADLDFAHRTWRIHFYAKAALLGNRAAWTGTMIFMIGLLLSLIAAYAAVALPRHLSRKRTMREFNERFGGFFEHHPFAVYAMDAEHRFIHVNQQMARELGLNRDALIGQPVRNFIAAEKRDMAARYFSEAMEGNTLAYTNQVVDANGRCSDLSVVLVPMSAGGKVSHVLGFAENITERKRAELALHDSRQMLQLILDNIPQSVFWKDRDGVFLGGNRSLLVETGLDSIDQLVGKTDADFPLWKDQAAGFRQLDLEVMESGVARMRMQATDLRRDGSECWIETSKIPLRDEAGEVMGVLAVTEDITARKYMEEELFRRANYDTLTGLPNRGYFSNQLEDAVRRARRSAGLALMYFDIDRFKQINDTHGHDVGDEVIRMFARRVRQVVRESDFMARLGGDEFVLIAEGLHQPVDAALIAGKIVESMAPPFKAGGTTLQVSSSIGIAWFEAGMTPESLVKAADQAMYEAKRAGRNCFRQREPAEQVAD